MVFTSSSTNKLQVFQYGLLEKMSEGTLLIQSRKDVGGLWVMTTRQSHLQSLRSVDDFAQCVS